MPPVLMSRSTAVAESFNLPLLRAWCRKNDAWLSLRTRAGDRYFINPYGYFVEILDGRLSQITPRVAFPLVNCYPSVMLSDLELQSGFGSAAYFVYAFRQGDVTGPPNAIKLSQLRHELDAILKSGTRLTPPELYVAIRVVENGFISEEELEKVIHSIKAGQTLGQELISSGLCSWEVMLGACMDTRTPANFDPPGLDRKTFLREWELAGEILVTMGKITRTRLEYALRIKKEGERTIGEILTAIGACTATDIEESLVIQNAVREARGSEVGLIGELLVKRGVIDQESLTDALHRQHISGQPIGAVLHALGYCSQEDLSEYKKNNGWHAFQGEIEDNNLASWMLTRQRINEQQLKHAYQVQGRGRQMLGQILVAMGTCSAQQVDDTLYIQDGARRLKKTGIEKIGSILLAQGRVDQKKLEEAISTQRSGRKALGEILQAVAGCSQAAVRLAIEIQRVWRDKMEQHEDRLGEVLQHRGFLSDENLKVAMLLQEESKKPMGQVLVENKFCTPEEIIATLLMRDYKRQCDLHAFIKKGLTALAEVEDTEGSTTERLLQAWIHKQGQW
ncbi:MAG TPA: hypothetical protein V6D22_14850 [Candidatus Obscuribacterales bacterium]